MTNRERWTVYPLLFFSLALGFRSNYRNPLEFQSRRIECQSLTVRGNANVSRINGRDAEVLIRRTHEALTGSNAAASPAQSSSDLPAANNSAAEEPERDDNALREESNEEQAKTTEENAAPDGPPSDTAGS